MIIRQSLAILALASCITVGTTYSMEKTQEQLGKDLVKAVKNRNLKRVKTLLSYGAPVNYADTTDGRNNTALHIAANKGFPAIVTVLINHGADKDKKNTIGRTAQDRVEHRLKVLPTNKVLQKQRKTKITRRLNKVLEILNAPAQEAPVVEAPAQEAPVVEAPVVEAPAQEAPVVEAPVVEAPVVEAPVEEAHVEEAHVEEQPIESSN